VRAKVSPRRPKQLAISIEECEASYECLVDVPCWMLQAVRMPGMTARGIPLRVQRRMALIYLL
jgi:hypothetical protein